MIPDIVITILRTIGLPGVILVAGYVYYEGVPIVRDVPFIGQLASGRVEAERQKARAGYVLETQLVAAQARAEEYRRQVDGGNVVIAAYQQQLANIREREAKDDAENAAILERYRAAGSPERRACRALDASDVDFLR